MPADPSSVPATVRRAGPADVPAIHGLWNALIPSTTYTWREDLVALEEIEEWFTERQGTGCPVLVADDGGDVTGFCSWGPFRGGPRYPGYRATVEHTIHVRADRHGGGTADALMDALLAEAVDRGIHVMVAGVDATNERSLRFHRRLGFTEVARMPEVGQKWGRWLDLVLLQRFVPTSHRGERAGDGSG